MQVCEREIEPFTLTSILGSWLIAGWWSESNHRVPLVVPHQCAVSSTQITG